MKSKDVNASAIRDLYHIILKVIDYSVRTWDDEWKRPHYICDKSGHGLAGLEWRIRALYQLFSSLLPNEGWMLYQYGNDGSPKIVADTIRKGLDRAETERRLKNALRYDDGGRSYGWGLIGFFEPSVEVRIRDQDITEYGVDIFQRLADILPNIPNRDEQEKNPIEICSNGTDILCRTEEEADALADLLEQTDGIDYPTSFYDPAEDKQDGEVDLYTGWYAF